jgi:hypothetical protein
MGKARLAVWKGTADEALALLQAVKAHCGCETSRVRTLAPCTTHTMLASDQRALDGLVFMRRMAPRLVREEFEAPEAAAA